MKNFFIIAIFSCLIFTGCKKDRVCSCSVETFGTKTTRSQSAGVTFTINLGIPLPIPPIELSPAKDTTIVAPFIYLNSLKTNYTKVSKGAMKKNCPTSFEENFTDASTTIIPGTSTITINETGVKSYKCEIE